MSEQQKARRTKQTDRVPLYDQRDQMNVLDQDPAFVYRWVNDTDNGQRVLKFQKAGYEVVQGKATVGDPTVENKTDNTSTINEKYVGHNMKAILMRIPREWYDEDQKAKQKRVDDAEALMKKEELAKYGELRSSKLDISRRK